MAERGWGIDVFMCGDPSTIDGDSASRVLPSGVRVFAVPAPRLQVERVESAVHRALKRRHAGDVALAGSGSPVPQRQHVSSVPTAELRWNLHSPRGWMRAYWAALDFARIAAWGSAVVDAAAQVVDPCAHRAVIASGPPFMSHDVGRRMGQRFRLPFIMDMRDPWSHVERLTESIATPMWTRMASRYEAKAVQQAALVVTNTDVARRQMVSTYPARAADIITVTNGADDEELPPPRRGGRFVIAHAGTIYLDRDPRGLFRAAAQVIRRLSLTPVDFTLEFIGDMEAVGGFPIEEVARAEGISEYVRTGPSRSYRDAIAFMSEATMLVTMSGSNMAAIPAKTFECVRFSAWILALSSPGSATALLLVDTGADVASPDDATAIASILERRYREHAAGVLPEPVGRDPRFSRRHQAAILLDAVESRIGR